MSVGGDCLIKSMHINCLFVAMVMFVCIGWGPSGLGDSLKGWIQEILQIFCLKAEVGVDLLYW